MSTLLLLLPRKDVTHLQVVSGDGNTEHRGLGEAELVVIHDLSLNGTTKHHAVSCRAHDEL
jgi:hypothetical protein